MWIRKNIPNAITCGNLLAGCIGLVFVQQNELLYAALAILSAGFLDLMDGLIARLLGVSSPIGGELDSLADLVSFGVLPSMLIHHYLGSSQWVSAFPFLPYLAFLIPVFAAIRLARFNLDEEQDKEFKGMPVPANALFWVGIPLAGWQIQGFRGPEVPAELFEGTAYAFFVHPLFLLSMTLLFAALMVAPIPCTSFKFQHFWWNGNEARYLLIGAVALLFPFLAFIAIPFLVLLYPVLSMFRPTRRSP